MRAGRALVVLAGLAMSCRHAPDAAVLEARTLHVDGAGAMRATYFPPRAPREGRHAVPVLLVEPVLFDHALLYSGTDGGLAPYLAAEGFRVWVVWHARGGAPSPRELARGIVDVAGSIARETGAHRFDVVGVSLGAEGTLRALETLTAPGSGVEVRKVAFVGGGFDFDYPKSFAARVARLRGGGAAALCTLDGDVGCARLFRHPVDAIPWLGVIPRADEDPLAPARARFGFVAGLTTLPVLFVNGKGDGIAPSESMFPVYSLWGSREPDASLVPKRMFLAGRENGLGEDYDHFALLGGAHAASEVWEPVAAWLARE